MELQSEIPLIKDLKEIDNDITEIAFAIRSLIMEMRPIDDLAQRKLVMIRNMMSTIIQNRS